MHYIKGNENFPVLSAQDLVDDQICSMLGILDIIQLLAELEDEIWIGSLFDWTQNLIFISTKIFVEDYLIKDSKRQQHNILEQAFMATKELAEFTKHLHGISHGIGLDLTRISYLGRLL